MNVLTLNAGSSSIKYKAYQVEHDQLQPLLSGLIEGIGESQSTWHHTKEIKETIQQPFKTHEEAFLALSEKLHQDLEDYPIQGIGHRVVHGGNHYYHPTVITPEVLAGIQALEQLAPIHNPINALGIQFAQRHFPKALQIAIFDSGFHHEMPSYVRQYAIHTELANRYQIRRYGFHGINHEYVSRQAAAYLSKPLENCNFISLHLGNGASACLVKNGKSFDTSMGMTPLAGLVMGTRCGDIDPAIVLYLQRQGMTVDEVDKLLNKQSGLKGIAAENDMRKVIARALANDANAQLALEMYIYAIQKIIGAYITQTINLDALIFTGGVGENASFIREKVITPLEHLGFELDLTENLTPASKPCHQISSGRHPVLVIRGDEEALMAQKVANLA
ncbi:acetate/propionate family kinase [Legionella fairfieldensis]|uniref:acetate/propionate family kinase n=1 Tax=Legionella fairfieldensis TaxID=45064 RepID=UPI00048B0602|nr:acetate kinase [Legionella fairfieldensis]